MAERRENSVLYSLRELRNIEDDRVKQEEDAEKARVESERQAEEDAKRRAKEEEDRKAIEERDRLARLDAEKERQIREEKLRLEETERRARIEAQAKVDAARIEAEMRAAQAKKGHLGLILGSVGGVVLLAIGALLYVFLSYIPAQRAEDAKRQQENLERAVQRALADQKAQIEQRYDNLIANAKDEATRDRLKAEKLAAQKAAEAEAAKKVRRPSGPAGPKKPGGLKLNCDPDKDPLCGSGL
jgi:colicin import membrane protein